MINQSIFVLLAQLWRHISSKRKMQLFLLLIIMIIASFFEVISIGAALPFLSILLSPDKVFNYSIMQPIIEVFAFKTSSELLFPITIFFIMGALFSGLMRLFLLWTQTTLSYAIGADLSSEVYLRTLYQPYEVHIGRNTSVIIDGIASKSNTVVGGVLMPALTIISSTLILISIVATLLIIDSSVALTTFLGFGLVYVLIILGTKKMLLDDSRTIGEESRRVIKSVQEGLGAIRDILIDGTQKAYYEVYRRSDVMMRRSLSRVAVLAGAPRYIVEALGMTLIASLAYSLTKNSSGLIGAVPLLGSLVLGAQRTLPLLQQSYSSWSSMRGNQDSIAQIIELMEQPLPTNFDSCSSLCITFQNAISIKNLSFQYRSQQSHLVLSDINLTINKGDRIGIMGETGSGKSTLIDIIMGLLEPTSGSLDIDGHKILKSNARAWQNHIAHVPQSIFLADGTIAENIAFGLPDFAIDYGRVKIAAAKAQIATFVESLPDQYQSRIGERGIRLSGGQRQRIGIARALYKMADLIIFDEATSALDGETEEAVMKTIKDLGNDLTVLIVAHRLTTLKTCRQIIELKRGKIARTGTYEEIIGKING